MSRRDLDDFRRELSDGGHLLVHMVTAAPAEPLLRDAIRHWRGNIARRGHTCAACKRSFAGGLQVGTYLLAVPSTSPASCGVSAICARCAHALLPDDIDAVATKILRRVIPKGTFHPEDAR